MNELIESTTNNISAWDINVQHGKWFYPDPDPVVPDKWTICHGEDNWYGWEGEHGTPAVIRTFLNTTGTGTGTLEYGNCGEAGNVTVSLDGELLDTAGAETMNVFTFEFDNSHAVELMLTHTLEPNVDKDSFPIIQFIDITLIC